MKWYSEDEAKRKVTGCVNVLCQYKTKASVLKFVDKIEGGYLLVDCGDGTYLAVETESNNEVLD